MWRDCLDIGDFRLVGVLVDRLSYEERSLHRARMLAERPPARTGEPDPVAEWYGYGRTAARLDDLADLLDLLIDVTSKHGSGKRARVNHPARRPGRLSIAHPKTVAAMRDPLGGLV